ncbi:MAG: signal peptidase I, partial [Ignavibacteriales bacterium]|nr:signal peptidase I [Ignavibacteriales bacterium]
LLRYAVAGARILLITFLAAILLKAFVVEAFRIPSPSMENTLQAGDFILVNKLAYGLRLPKTIPLTNVRLAPWNLALGSSIKRGDVIVFEFPGWLQAVNQDEPVNFVKRVVGLPGDQVEIRCGQVLVNGEAIDLPPFGKPSLLGDGSRRGGEKMFPPGSFYTGIDYGPVRVPKAGERIALSRRNAYAWRALIAREGHAVHLTPRGSLAVDGESAFEYTIEHNYYFVLGDNRDNSLDSRYWGFVPEDNIVGEALMIYWSWNTAGQAVAHAFAPVRWDRIGTIIK